MASKRRANSRPKRAVSRGALAAHRVRGGATADGFISQTISASAIVAVGVLNLVKQTIATAVTGATDVGAELGTAAMRSARGTVRSAYAIGADLGIVARETVRGTLAA